MRRPVLAVLLFGIAFGYLEAAVVCYLRDLHEPVRQRYYPGRPPSELFPLVTLEQTLAVEPKQTRTLAIEIGREAATLLMLAGVALAAARNPGQWAALFGIAFGVWDIFFYVFLKLLIGWPASLLTWDILFLIPLPWVGPVVAPVLVSCAMIGAGLWSLRREAAGDPVLFGRWHGAGIVAGGLIVIVSFTLDYANILAGGFPRPFNWAVFAAGMATGALSYARAASTRVRAWDSVLSSNR
jgi:hypothetical protein